MVQKPSMLCHTDYPINDRISVHIPSVQEIYDFGEQKYYSIVQSLTATPYDLMVELDDIGIDFETINEYQLFILMFGSIAAREKDTSILFGNLDLTSFCEMENIQTGERVLRDEENNITIDRLLAMEICQAIRKMHFWTAPEAHMGNLEAKKYIIERTRIKKKRRAKMPYQSLLDNMIIKLVNTSEFPYNYESVLQLSIYKLNASWHQIPKMKQWEQTMNGVYFGTVDSSKLDLQKLSWMSPD